ncbi:pol polyprotein [Lasius niger]|uniref:RNA-directed DNA polymerase n=1 Tax=Lasius niger TaxID=67767 RepID=A0A0J7K7I7_LASNI|nr:pol polyprotein [Lasius niger]
MPMDRSPTRGTPGTPVEGDAGPAYGETREQWTTRAGNGDLRIPTGKFFDYGAVGEPPTGSTLMATRQLKLPQPFWKEMPAHWFQIAEATFALHKITSDETKYRYVLTNLDPSVIPFVSDLITNPPATSKYDALRSRIINSFEETQESKLRKLLRGQDIADERPSHFLQRLRTLAGGQCTDSVIRSLFLDQLPEAARGVLAVSSLNDLDGLATMADKVVDIIKPQVVAIRQEDKSANHGQQTEPLTTQMQELRAMVEKLTVEVRKGRPRANGTRIKTYGERTLELDLNLRRNFASKFVIADIGQPILGADFLHRYNLLVDLRNHRLVDGTTNLRTEGKISRNAVQSISTINNSVPCLQLLKEFIEVTRPVAGGTPKHPVEHVILTKGPPVPDRPRRLSPGRSKFAQREINGWIEAGTCRPGKGQWASAMHLVKRGPGHWRICGDYRQLNRVTVPDKYPIPHIQDFSQQLHGCILFSTLDLTRAYHQIPVTERDKEKTALITPFGLYEFNVMPFGLRNAAQTFQRLMDTVLRGLEFCFCYIDDILIASQSEEQHRRHVRQVLTRLRQYGLSINVDKCSFFQKEVRYLGCTVSSKGTKPLKDRVDTILRYKEPHTVEQLRRFLGMINYYRRFLPSAAQTQAPLYSLATGTKKKDRRPIQWDNSTRQAFQQCKDQLANAALLAHPTENAPLILSTDASDKAIGAVLEQVSQGHRQPLAFFSRKLNKTQVAYSAYDRELLAMYEATKHFRYFIEGRELTILTDQKPLTYAFHQRPEKASPRQLRQLEYLSQFVKDIKHVAGPENVVADTLSRLEAIEMPVIVSTEELAQEQRTDPELQTLLRGQTTLNLKPLRLDDSDTQIYCEVTDKIRIYVPQSLRQKVFNTVHNLAHPGAKSTRKTVTQRFVWPSINKDIAEWVRTCLKCQRAKISRHNHPTPQHIHVPDDRFQHIHLDIIGPLPLSKGYRYCLTMIDRTTRWPEAIPIVETSANTIATNLLNTWIARFGAPETITTDRGSQFESIIFETLAQMIGARRIRTTAYHPQSNGMIERWHRSLKTAIKCHTTPEWTEILPLVLLGLRTSYKDDIGTSAAEMVYGTTLRLPGEYFIPGEQIQYPQLFANKLREYMQTIRPKPTQHHTTKKAFIHQALNNCTHVFVRVDRPRRPFENPYEGPFPIITRTNESIFRVSYKGRPTEINIERLKPAFTENTNLDLELPAELQPSTSSNQGTQQGTTVTRLAEMRRKLRTGEGRLPPRSLVDL